MSTVTALGGRILVFRKAQNRNGYGFCESRS